MKTRIYVGTTHKGESRIFKCDFKPTEASHGAVYAYVTGPFRTREGAEYMARFGKNNPHCLSVDSAERLARANTRLVRRSKNQ